MRKILMIFITHTLLFGTNFVSIHDLCEVGCNNNPKEIELLQKFLNIDRGITNRVKVTTLFDNATKKAVKEFQKKHALLPTGYVGYLTKQAMQKELNKKLLALAKRKKSNKKIDFLLNNQSTQIHFAKQKELIPYAFSNVHFKTYKEFRKRFSPKSYAIYKNPKLLALAGKAKTLLKVDVSEQRVKLLVNGAIALDAPCTTGSYSKFEPNTKTYRDKHTPFGTFKILEKIANKRSNIFGRIYKNGKLVFVGDRRKYRGSWKGAKFVGAPLFHWMRLTNSGIGIHVGKHIRRYPHSNGCIELSKDVAKLLFSKLKVGMTVKVVN